MVPTDVAFLIHSPHFLSGILQGCLALTQLIQAHRCFVGAFLLVSKPHQSNVELQFNPANKSAKDYLSASQWFKKWSQDCFSTD